jgi:hypothetical protein
MTEEDEAFNEIERQAKQRKEAVRAALEPYLEVYKNPPRNKTDQHHRRSGTAH